MLQSKAVLQSKKAKIHVNNLAKRKVRFCKAHYIGFYPNVILFYEEKRKIFLVLEEKGLVQFFGKSLRIERKRYTQDKSELPEVLFNCEICCPEVWPSLNL